MAAIKQKITPYLWFDSEAEDAARIYTSLFDNSAIGNVSRYGKAGFEIHGQPEGKVMAVAFELGGQRFVALNAGPIFRFNPSVSFLIECNTKGEVEQLWRKLSENGTALMELGEYPFSEKYGWVQDKFGLSWQMIFMGDRRYRQKVTPMLMFVGEQCGKAEEAIHFYASIFDNASVGDIFRHGKTGGPDREGTVAHASFTLSGQEFAAMDSAQDHQFKFSEAISFMVQCDTQKEIDYYWEKLSAHPEAEQCGWLKDKYGLSWQIVPAVLEEMLQTKEREKVERVTEAFLKMKKFDIQALNQAYAGKNST